MKRSDIILFQFLIPFALGVLVSSAAVLAWLAVMWL